MGELLGQNRPALRLAAPLELHPQLEFDSPNEEVHPPHRREEAAEPGEEPEENFGSLPGTPTHPTLGSWPTTSTPFEGLAPVASQRRRSLRPLPGALRLGKLARGDPRKGERFRLEPQTGLLLVPVVWSRGTFRQ